MTKKTIIVILILVSFVSIMEAFFQYAVANRTREQAEQNLVIAKQSQIEVQKHAEIAHVGAERANKEALAAREARNLAEDLSKQLEKCKGKK